MLYLIISLFKGFYGFPLSRIHTAYRILPFLMQACRFVPYIFTFLERKPRMVPMCIWNFVLQGLALIQGQIYNPVRHPEFGLMHFFPVPGILLIPLFFTKHSKGVWRAIGTGLLQRCRAGEVKATARVEVTNMSSTFYDKQVLYIKKWKTTCFFLGALASEELWLVKKSWSISQWFVDLLLHAAKSCVFDLQDPNVKHVWPCLTGNPG